ncbi:MAG: hypothetical protein ACREBR_01825, partial [bacterium]
LQMSVGTSFIYSAHMLTHRQQHISGSRVLNVSVYSNRQVVSNVSCSMERFDGPDWKETHETKKMKLAQSRENRKFCVSNWEFRLVNLNPLDKILAILSRDFLSCKTKLCKNQNLLCKILVFSRVPVVSET